LQVLIEKLGSYILKSQLLLKKKILWLLKPYYLYKEKLLIKKTFLIKAGFSFNLILNLLLNLKYKNMKYHIKKIIYLYFFFTSLIFSQKIFACEASHKKPKLSDKSLEIVKKELLSCTSEEQTKFKADLLKDLLSDLEAAVMVFESSGKSLDQEEKIRNWLNENLEELFDEDEYGPTFLLIYKDLESEELKCGGFFSSSEDLLTSSHELCFYLSKSFRRKGLFYNLLIFYESLLAKYPSNKGDFIQISFRSDNMRMLKLNQDLTKEKNYIFCDLRSNHVYDKKNKSFLENVIRDVIILRKKI